MSKLHVIAASSDESVSQNAQVLQCDSIGMFEQLARIKEIVEQSSAQWFLLTNTNLHVEQIPDIESLQANQPYEAATWLPIHPESFADFTVRSLGTKMASLWFGLWDAGLIVVPADSLRKAIQSSETLHEVMIKLEWSELSEPDCLDIDWSDESVELPCLAPRRQREELNAVEPFIHNLEDWLSEDFDRSSPDFVALRAGLYQWYDALEVSHNYSQDAQHDGINRAADYWHGIMHRREPDDSNAKYWYRHVGDHPVYRPLLKYARSISSEMIQSSAWEPFAFVDFCSKCRKGMESSPVAEKIQAVEMVLLMKQTMQDARK